MRIAIGILFSLVCISGCQTVVKTAYGIKKPRLEDDQSITKYLLKHRIDTSRTFVLKDLNSFATASQQEILNIPDAMFFNKQGEQIPYRESSSSCNANVDKFILDLKNIDKVAPNSTIKMDSVLKLMRASKTRQTEISDISVIITWTIYAGKLNEDKAFEWVRLLQTAKAKGIDVNYYLLNCDFQKSWNIPQNVQEKLGIKN